MVEHVGLQEGQAGHWRRSPHTRDQQEVICAFRGKEMLMSVVPTVCPCVGAEHRGQDGAWDSPAPALIRFPRASASKSILLTTWDPSI